MASSSSRDFYDDKDHNHPSVILSKKLSVLLRHRAEGELLEMDSSGWVPVNQILKLPKFQFHDEKQIIQVVKNNPKQRFSIKKEIDGSYKIRANQGHSIKSVTDIDLRPITPKEVEEKNLTVIHGTFHKNIQSILHTGLSKMKRNHIHFASGLTSKNPEEEIVIPGLRTNAELLIYIDVISALKDGIEFYYSTNNVILSPGNENGILPASYFLQVVNAKSKQKIKF